MSHAKRRLAERFGIQLTPQLSGMIRRLIVDGTAEFIGKESNAVYLYQVDIGEQQVIVVYNYPNRRIVTVLKPGMRYGGCAGR